MSFLSFKITKYLYSKIATSFIFIFIILSLIIFGNQFFLVLAQSLKNGLYSSELFPLMFFKVLRDSSFIIALSFTLATILSISKLNKSSEIIVLNSAGYGDLGLARLLLPLFLVLTIICGLVSFFIAPMSTSKIFHINESAKSRPDYIFIKEGTFQNFKNNITFFSPKVEQTENKNKQILKDIFIYNSDEKKILLANNGEKVVNELTGDVFLDLYNGSIYENIDNNPRGPAKITDFKKFRILIFEDFSKEILFSKTSDAKNFSQLLFYDPKDLAEFFFRISSPLSMLVMAFLSVLLSQNSPRSKRNFGLAYGLIIYIVYFNSIIFFKDMISNSDDYFFVYMLTPHILFILIFIMIYFFRNGFFISQGYKL